MLPPHNRMRSRLDFAETVRAGRRAGRGDVVVHLLLAPSESRSSPQRDFEQGGSRNRGRSSVAAPSAPKVGLVVGKQVGGSVIRKRVSRQLRAAVHGMLPALPQSSRLVVRALPGAAEAEFAELAAQLRSAVRKLAPRAPEEKGRP